MVKRKPIGPYKYAAERIGMIVFSTQDYLDDTGHITEKIDKIEKLLREKFEAKGDALRDVILALGKVAAEMKEQRESKSDEEPIM